jgi:hypothetical protein
MVRLNRPSPASPPLCSLTTVSCPTGNYPPPLALQGITIMNQTHTPTPFLVLKQIVQFWRASYNGRNESSEEGEDKSFIQKLNVFSNEDRWKQEISVKTLHGKIILIRYDRTESHTLGSWIKHLLGNKERDINHQMFNFLFNGVMIADLKKRIQEIEGKSIYSQRLVSTKILEDDEPIPFDVVKYDIHLFDRLRGGARTKLMARYGEDYDPNYETKKRRRLAIR